MTKARSMCGLLLLAGLSLSLAGLRSVAAQEDAGSLNNSVTATDKLFVIDAVRAGTVEMELARLATQRGGDSSVLLFAQRMVREHKQMSDELKMLAEKKGVSLPKEGLDPKTRAFKEQLALVAQRSLYQFDRDFMRKMVQDHDAAVALFERETRIGKDQAIRDWAERYLPMLINHLENARDVEQDLKRKTSAKR